MARSSSPIFLFFPGIGGDIPDFSGFNVDCSDIARIEALTYPGWRQSASKGFTIEVLIGNLEAQIVSKVPEGPIRIIGYSIGGLFGYATAVRLRATGREIAGFCAIDSFLIGSLGPSAKWKIRALSEALEILRKGHLREFNRFIRTKFWRGLFRLAGNRLRSLTQGFSSCPLPSVCAFDPILERELNLRLLLQAAAPWSASLDREPMDIDAPASLLRTRMTAKDDAAWRHRCPNIKIFEIPGEHHTLFEAENIGSLSEAFLTATHDWGRKGRTKAPFNSVMVGKTAPCGFEAG